MPANVSWFDFKCSTLAPALWLDNKTENQRPNQKKKKESEIYLQTHGLVDAMIFRRKRQTITNNNIISNLLWTDYFIGLMKDAMKKETNNIDLSANAGCTDNI